MWHINYPFFEKKKKERKKYTECTRSACGLGAGIHGKATGCSGRLHVAFLRVSILRKRKNRAKSIQSVHGRPVAWMELYIFR